MGEAAYDVVVVGAGNAALCAAISAHENGARVLVLEKAPEDEKGGNSYFTAGGFRFMHNGLDDVREDVLVDMSDDEADKMVLPTHDRQFFYETLMKVTRGQSNEDLAWTLIDGSRPAMAWLRGNAPTVNSCPACCMNVEHQETHMCVCASTHTRAQRRLTSSMHATKN